MHYDKYISSRNWRYSPTRLKELSDAHGRCRICFAAGTSAQPIEVHHATYARLGQEQVGDLVALCRACHGAVTNFLRERRHRARSPRRADAPQTRDPRALTVDPTRS